MNGKPSDRCLKILDLLPRFIENDFSPEESAEILEHLGSCATCEAEHEAMSRLLNTLEGLPSIGVPASFKDAVMKHIPPAKGKPAR